MKSPWLFKVVGVLLLETVAFVVEAEIDEKINASSDQNE